MGEDHYHLTVGPVPDGRTLAIISRGGHLQIPGSGQMEVCTVEIVDGWSKKEIRRWFKRQCTERPWETRQ